MNNHKPWMRNLADGLLDLLYPPHCVSCGHAGAWLCQHCQDAIPWITYPICPRCGRPQSTELLCRLCSARPSYVEAARSLSPHTGPLRDAVHGLKYEGLRMLAPPLGELLARGWRRYGLEAELIVPVPLHSARERQRGYNQAALLAQVLGQQTHVDMATGLLVRVRDTISQVGLSGSERWRNVNGAFEATGSVEGVHVLVVDDVYTTGATFQACGAALLQAGAASVSALSLTRALDRQTYRQESEIASLL